VGRPISPTVHKKLEEKPVQTQEKKFFRPMGDNHDTNFK
jgi:hypothetical protein